jgi:hypothetical protein
MSIPTPDKATVIEWPELKHGFLSGYETGDFPQHFRNREGWIKGTRARGMVVAPMKWPDGSGQDLSLPNFRLVTNTFRRANLVT